MQRPALRRSRFAPYAPSELQRLPLVTGLSNHGKAVRWSYYSNSAFATVAVADVNRLLHRNDKDFAVADMPFGARAGDFLQAFDRAIDKVVIHSDFERDLS